VDGVTSLGLSTVEVTRQHMHTTWTHGHTRCTAWHSARTSTMAVQVGTVQQLVADQADDSAWHTTQLASAQLYCRFEQWPSASTCTAGDTYCNICLSIMTKHMH
jgi:hypothetical protein